MQGSADQASVGRLMPTAEEMLCVWDAMYDPIASLMDDQVTPAEAAATMQADAAACVEEMHTRFIHLPLVVRNE